MEMDAYLSPKHRALEKRVETFAERVEMVDYICEDANVADAYIKTWAKTQHAVLARRSAPKGVVQYLRKIESRGFTSEGILGTVSRELVRMLGAEGLLRYVVEARHGGYAPRIDPVALCLIRRSLARRSTLVDMLFTMQGLGSHAITLAGTDAARKRWLPGVADGSLIAAVAITEPEAGSDILSIETRADRTRSGYVLSGCKTLISNAGIADFYVVYARTAEGSSRDPEALTAFVVDRKSPGLSLARKLEVISPHPIGEIRLDKVAVPADHRIGKEGEGFELAMRTLDLFRTSVGAAAVGMASRALRESLDHAGRRKQFGRLLSDFQSIRFKLAEMATQLRAAELMVFSAAWEKARGRTGPESSMAKLFATEAAQHIIDEAVQIHGGMGVVRGSAVERLYRGIRALRIYEGTSEIQKIVIARSLTGER